MNERIVIYRNLKQVGFNHVKIIGGPHEWWAGEQSTFPTVAKLARKYLAVQATSTAFHRIGTSVLSIIGGVNTIANKLNRLSEEMAADIILSHETLKNNLW